MNSFLKMWYMQETTMELPANLYKLVLYIPDCFITFPCRAVFEKTISYAPTVYLFLVLGIIFSLVSQPVFVVA